MGIEKLKSPNNGAQFVLIGMPTVCRNAIHQTNIYVIYQKLNHFTDATGSAFVVTI